MAPHLFTRQSDGDSTINNYLAGGLIGGFILLVVSLCLLCHFCLRRRKPMEKRVEQRAGASLPSSGAVRPMMMELDPSSKSASTPHPVSREKITASIIMPEKTIIRKAPSSHTVSGKVAVVPSQPEPPPPPSHPSQSPTHRPRSGASTVSPRPHSMSLLNPACNRQSRASSSLSGYLPASPSSPSSSFRSASSTHGTKAVRQTFEPTLPDELAIFRCGEYLTVLESFDDGWCLVVRDTSSSSRASRLSAWMKRDGKAEGDEVDIGLVPAWVFVKPLQGVTVARPPRSSSVNALQFGHPQSSNDARNAIISWSNFA